MAQDWLGLMRKVPWKTVAEAAPAIAEAARSLGKRLGAARDAADDDVPARPATDTPAAAGEAPGSRGAGADGAPIAPAAPDEAIAGVLRDALQAMAALEARVDALDARNVELRAELERASARLAAVEPLHERVRGLDERVDAAARGLQASGDRLGRLSALAWSALALAAVAAVAAAGLWMR